MRKIHQNTLLNYFLVALISIILITGLGAVTKGFTNWEFNFKTEQKQPKEKRKLEIEYVNNYEKILNDSEKEYLYFNVLISFEVKEEILNLKVTKNDSMYLEDLELGVVEHDLQLEFSHFMLDNMSLLNTEGLMGSCDSINSYRVSIDIEVETLTKIYQYNYYWEM